MKKFIALTSVTTEIRDLKLNKKSINAVYTKLTAGGRFTAVVSNGTTYFVKETVEEVLKKVNSWF